MALRRDTDGRDGDIRLPVLQGVEHLRNGLDILHLELETGFLGHGFPEIDAKAHQLPVLGKGKRLHRLRHDPDFLLGERGTGEEATARDGDDDPALAAIHPEGISLSGPSCQSPRLHAPLLL